jgi:hypothetical protein
MKELAEWFGLEVTRPSKFVVMANDAKGTIKMAWEHGGSEFQALFDRTTAQAQEMKEGALRVL